MLEFDMDRNNFDQNNGTELAGHESYSHFAYFSRSNVESTVLVVINRNVIYCCV